MSAVVCYPECDVCDFKTAYAVDTEFGQMILCAGCLADTRAAGHYARLLRSLPRPRPSGNAVWKAPRRAIA